MKLVVWQVKIYGTTDKFNKGRVSTNTHAVGENGYPVCGRKRPFNRDSKFSEGPTPSCQDCRGLLGLKYGKDRIVNFRRKFQDDWNPDADTVRDKVKEFQEKGGGITKIKQQPASNWMFGGLGEWTGEW